MEKNKIPYLYINMNYNFIIILFAFIIGLYFVSTHKTNDVIEGFNGSGTENCPNLLMKKDDAYYLYNTNKLHVPGVNPIKFNNLEDYTEFIDWSRGQGIRCPVLFLQQTYDTQGKRTYRVLPDPENPNAGLPPQRMPKETKLYDAGHQPGSMPSFDPLNQYIGDYTPLDAMFHDTENKYSDSAMDTNWGGIAYTEKDIAEGKYAGDTN